MAAPTPPSTPPSVPLRSEGQTVFSSKSEAFLQWITSFYSWLVSLAPWIESRANETEAWANQASTAANTASTAANAQLWVSGTTYAVGVSVIDPVDLFTYRRRVAGTGTTRPGLDATNWMQMGTVKVDFPNNFTAVQNFSAGITGVQFGFKNLFFNPFGTINQRVYASGAATTASNQYTIDRWRVVVSGQSLTWTINGNRFVMTAPAGGVEQIIKGSNIYGGSYVLNWVGTATATVNGTPRTKGEVFTLVGGANCTVRFVGGTFDEIQIERGTVATPFEQRPGEFEFVLCQAYYKTGIAGLDVYEEANRLSRDAVSFGSRMQAVPTVTQVATESIDFLTTPQQSNLTINGFFSGRFKSATTGKGTWLNTWTASAELS